MRRDGSGRTRELACFSGLVVGGVAIQFPQQRTPRHLVERCVAVGNDARLLHGPRNNRLRRNIRLNTAGKRHHLHLAGTDQQKCKHVGFVHAVTPQDKAVATLQDDLLAFEIVCEPYAFFRRRDQPFIVVIADRAEPEGILVPRNRPAPASPLQ